MKENALYGTIINYILNCIKDESFTPNQRIPTEMELVNMFKVSRPTVNKALNELSLQGIIYRIPGKGSFVSNPLENEKRKRNSVKIVSLITPFAANIPDRMDETYIIRGVENYLKNAGYYLTVQFTNQDAEIERQLIHKCRDEGIDGIILYPIANNENAIVISELHLDCYPIVVLDRNFTSLNMTSVQSDNRKGGYLAASHLIDYGYNDIYFVSDYKIQTVSSISERYFGYYSALKDNKRPIDEDKCIHGFNTTKSGVIRPVNYKDNPELLKKLLKGIVDKSSGKRCGVFAINDSLADSLLHAALDMNLNVPGDLGIVGFDDVGIAQNAVIPLTSIKQDFYEIGRISAKTLLEKIDNFSLPNDRILIDVDLVLRDSTTVTDSSMVGQVPRMA